MIFNLDAIYTDKKELLFTGEAAVESSISDAVGGVAKVLSVVADGSVVGVEALADETVVSGRINFKAIYLSGDGELKNLDVFNDFTKRIPKAAVADKVFAAVKVTDTDTTLGVTPKLIAAVSIEVYGIVGDSVECLAEADDSLYVEKKTVELSRYVTEISDSVVLYDEYSTRADISEILLFDSYAQVTGVTIGVENMLIEGKAVATVTYVADGDVINTVFKLPFSEEISNAALNIGQRATATATVKGGRVILGGVEGDNIVKVELTVAVTARVFETVDKEVIADVFSTERELKIDETEFVVKKRLGSATLESKLTGAVTFTEDMLPAKSVIDVVNARNNIANVIINDTLNGDNDKLNLTIEGIVTASVLYRDDEGVNSVTAEIPYSEAYALDGDIAAANELTVSGIVSDIYAKAKRDREIELFIELTMTVDGAETRVVRVISGVTEGEERPQNSSTVSVYIASDGEGIWEAAKALSARPDDIIKQNPDLKLPFSEGDRIVYFRQL